MQSQWALGSITTEKASGGYGIPVELFQILKDDAVKCCTQYASKLGKLSSGHKTGKGQFSFQSLRKKKHKKAKWLSEEGLQIAEKWGEAKGKGEKERYIYLNLEFQRIARRDKKNFLSEQCKEIEENNRMGKTRDLFNKIRDTKGTFHTKMGSIKDKNGTDLTEAEDSKKRWQEYTEELLRVFMIFMSSWPR